MADKYKVILFIIVIAVVIIFFSFFYTHNQDALKKAEEEYNALKKDLLNKNELLEKEIAAINADKIRIEKELSLEKERSTQLKSELNNTKEKLKAQLSQVEKMPDNEIVSNTRNFLSLYIRENPINGKNMLAQNDLFQTNTNVNWSFLSMRLNLGILTEHHNWRTEFIPKLEAESASFKKQSEYNSNLYAEEKKVSEKRNEQYENERTLRLKSESLYGTCKKTLKSGKIKSFLIGGGIGAGLVLILSLLK
ncbi:MAG: hypothetical protein MUF15_01655 [Acidobacteria bacterium]|jgi:septal ring factor EnvC (AmiA/AmiB activator)|nr:hypothetical protein [Acidobacteriota bacterium]